MNVFGDKWTFTSFGESHGVAIGGVLDGVPAGLHIDFDMIREELLRRKGVTGYGLPVTGTQIEIRDIVEVSLIFLRFSSPKSIRFKHFYPNSCTCAKKTVSLRQN